MVDNPLKYSDLIQKDDSIQQAITELEQLKQTYTDTLGSVSKEAIKVKVAMEQVSGATEQGREAIKRNATEADRLAKAQEELKFAMSDVGQQVAALKLQINDKNALSREEYKLVSSQSASYKEMKAQLTILRNEYLAMSQSERQSTDAGSQKLAQIINLNTQVKAIEKSMRALNNTQNEEVVSSRQVKQVLTDLEKARLKLTYATSDEASEIMQLNMETKRATEVARLNLILNSEVEGSYNRLSAQYSLNKIKLNEMSMEWRETTMEGKAFVAETNNIYQQMIKLQTATGKHTLSVGHYAKGWDGLGNSVSQLTRELPSLAMSANMFFLAISNNIPIMVDEINRLKASNAALKADNIATIPVWKSVLKSFMSWNTIMMVGVSLLTMFGGDLVDWIKKMMQGGNALDANTIAAKNYADAMKTVQEASLNGSKDAQKETIRLKLLYDATQDQTKNIRERLAAVDELQKQYPSYFKNLTDEEILAGKAAGAYTELTSAIIKSAMARAAENKIVENSEKQLALDEKIAKQKSKVYAAQVMYDKAVKRTAEDTAKIADDPSYAQSVIEDARVEAIRLKALKAAQSEMLLLTTQTKGLQAANEKLANSINVDALVNPPSENDKKGGGGKKEDRTEEIAKANLEALAKFQESETAILEDGLEKRRQKIRDDFKKAEGELLNQVANDEDLTVTSKVRLLKTILNLKTKSEQDLAQVDIDGNLERLKLEEEYLKLQLELVEKGTSEEADVKIALMENARKKELIENNKLTVEMRQSEASINDKWNKLIAKQRLETQNIIELEAFDKSQDAEAAHFNLIRRSEEAKKKFRIQQDIERWEKLLEIGMINGKKLNDIDIQNLKDLISAAKRESGEIGSGGFWGAIGWEPSDTQKKGFEAAFEMTKQNIKDILQMQIEAADIAIKKNEEKVASAQKLLDAEIEARNNGYASNVAFAQKQLDLEKKSLKKSQMEKEKAAKAQRAIDTAVQISSMITATAQIFSSMSGIPIIGWALAIAAVAAMWGTFAISKIKAAQIAKQSYGEGGYEFLDGGSHASGNDISIGKTKEGKDRRAEGGETLAIIKKSSTRKYRSVLPNIINSLNKGNFEQKYMHSYDTGSYNLNVNQSLDTKELEDDVKAIKEQGKRKYFVNGKGETVEIYKNRVRIYK